MANALSGTTNQSDIELANQIYQNYQENYNVVHDQLVGSYKDLILKVNDQNELIDTTSQRIVESQSTNFRKSDYENSDTQKLMNIYTYIFWIYYIGVIAFSIYLVFFLNYSMGIKGITISVFVLLPWLLHYTEVIVYNVSMWLYSIAMSKIYSNVYMS